MATTDGQVQQLVDGQSNARAQLTSAAVAAAAAEVTNFHAWYDPAAVAALTQRIVKRVEPAQRTAAAVTDAYLARVLTILRGRHVAPVGPVPVNDLRVGVSHADAYARLGSEFRYLRSTDVAEPVAQQRVLERAKVMADMDTTLAVRAQSRKLMVVRSVEGFRRVVRPELSKSGTCGLCIVAADKVYRRGDLLPIHAHCKCEVLPIVNGVDPGHSMNGEDLSAFYKEAGGNTAAKLKRTRYTVHQHGEFGPVLAVKGQAFRGPDDLPAAA